VTGAEEDRLLASFCAGELDDGDGEALLRALDGSAQLRARLAEHLLIAGSLRQLALPAYDVSSVVAALPRLGRQTEAEVMDLLPAALRTARRRRYAVAAGIAAAAAAVVLVPLALRKTPRSANAPAGEVATQAAPVTSSPQAPAPQADTGLRVNTATAAVWLGDGARRRAVEPAMAVAADEPLETGAAPAETALDVPGGGRMMIDALGRVSAARTTPAGPLVMTLERGRMVLDLPAAAPAVVVRTSAGTARRCCAPGARTR